MLEHKVKFIYIFVGFKNQTKISNSNKISIRTKDFKNKKITNIG